MEKAKLQWHPAFGAALRITLQDEMQYLEMHEEHLLSKKPLQIDVLIIKKLRDVEIKKTIGRIFRKHNIIEYKSPDDSLSVNDFYKQHRQDQRNRSGRHDAYFCMQSLSERISETSGKSPGDVHRVSGRRHLLSQGRSDPHAASDHSSDVR